MRKQLVVMIVMALLEVLNLNVIAQKRRNIRSIDFRNLKYESGDVMIDLYGGHYADGGNAAPTVSFVDFDDDGQEEAVFTTRADYIQESSAPGKLDEKNDGYYLTIYVFKYSNGKLQHIFINQTDRGSLRISGKSLFITDAIRTKVVRRGHALIHVPDLYKTSVYTWRGSGFTLSSSRTFSGRRT